MDLTTRIITNAGAPLCAPDGSVLAGVNVVFTLVNNIGLPSNGFDAISLQDVGGDPIVATTDAQGEFSVDLWPTQRGDRPLRYRCAVVHEGFSPFTVSLPDGVGPVQWAQLMAGSTSLSPQEITQAQLFLGEIEAARAAAEAAAAGAIGAVGSAIEAHVALDDPHTQYAKEADLADASDPAKGAALVSFLPAGTGAPPSTVAAALRAAVKGSASQKVKIIAGVLRNYGIAGAPDWRWIEDSNHSNLNMSTVTVVGKTLNIQFDNTYGKTLSMVCCPDDSYAAQGFTVGASVGTQNAIIYMGQRMTGVVNMISGIAVLSSPSLWPSANCVGSIDAAGMITLTHLDNGGAQPMVWAKEPTGSYRMPRFTVKKISGTITKIYPYEELSGYAIYNGSSWVIFSATVAGMTISETGGTVTITHPAVDAKTAANISTRDNGAVLAMPDSYTATSFTVKFRDFTGAAVTTNSTNMRFMFSRPAILPAIAYIPGEVYFDLGYMPVDMNYVAVPGSNIWIIGVFEDADDASP